MAESTPLAAVGKDALPTLVEINPQEGIPPHSPKEMTLLRELTGRDFTDLVAEGADQGDRERVIVWFKLRRLGYAPSWDEAGDVLVHYRVADPPSGGS